MKKCRRDSIKNICFSFDISFLIRTVKTISLSRLDTAGPIIIFKIKYRMNFFSYDNIIHPFPVLIKTPTSTGPNICLLHFIHFFILIWDRGKNLFVRVRYNMSNFNIENSINGWWNISGMFKYFNPFRLSILNKKGGKLGTNMQRFKELVSVFYKLF